MQVKKRDGKHIVEYDEKKISRAISLAAKKVKVSISEDDMKVLVQDVTATISASVKKTKITNDEGKEEIKEEPIQIKPIQEAIEKALVSHSYFDVATEFHNYRIERDNARFIQMDIVQEMQEKLSASNVQNQNANVDENSFGGRKGEADSALMKKLALDYMITPKFAKNHRNETGYIHDLDSYRVGMHNCLSVPIDDLCANSTSVKSIKDIRAAKSIMSFCQQVLVHIQSQSLMQFGGVSVTHLDWSAVPYIRCTFWKSYKEYLRSQDIFTGSKSKMPVSKEERESVAITDKRYKENKQVYKLALEHTKAETLQATEGLIHNLGTLMSRSGNQLPFSSINYGTCTLEEGRIFINALLDTWEAGIGEFGLTPIFPCGIFQYKKGVNDAPGTPNYDLLMRSLKVLTKRDYPNYANCDWSVQHKAFIKSQHIKEEALKSMTMEDLNILSTLPKETLYQLGFEIEDDGKDELTIVGVDE